MLWGRGGLACAPATPPMAAMITFEHHVGRLCEGWMSSPLTLAEMKSFATIVRSALVKIGKPAVVCTDMRAVTVFPPDVAEAFTALMKKDNHTIARSAFVINEGSVFGLQIERMLRDAGNPARRAFRVRAQLEKWLAEELTAAEKDRLAKFLNEHESGAATGLMRGQGPG
jgi:hypothetical protein